MSSRVTIANATVMLCCRVLADGLGIVLFVIVSRLLGPDGVGEYAYGFAVAGFMYSATTLGVEQYGVREYQRASPEDRGRLIAELLGVQLSVAAAAIVALTVYLGATRPTPAALLIVCALSLYQLSNAIAATLFVPALAEEKMSRPAALALLTRGLASAGACIVLWAPGGSLAAAMLAFPLMAFIYVGSAIHSARAHIGALNAHFTTSALTRAMGAMGSFATVELLGQLLARAGVIVLALMLGERAAGVYATGLKFIEVFFLPLWFAGVAVYPRLCSAWLDEPERFAKLASMLLWGGLAMTAPIALILYRVVPPLLVPVLGPGYAGEETAIGAMAAIALFYGAEMALGRVLFASDLHTYRAAAIAAGAAACLALNIALVRRMGVEGAIAATAIAYLAVAACYAIGLHAHGRRRAPRTAARLLIDKGKSMELNVRRRPI